MNVDLKNRCCAMRLAGASLAVIEAQTGVPSHSLHYLFKTQAVTKGNIDHALIQTALSDLRNSEKLKKTIKDELVNLCLTELANAKQLLDYAAVLFAELRASNLPLEKKINAFEKVILATERATQLYQKAQRGQYP
ncbi:MAG: hypothetical protein WBI40_13040 [Methylococcaceae bacterium]